MSKSRPTHAASLEPTGCWRRDKWSLSQNNMAWAQPLLMSHFDLGTFLQYSCLQIWALTCTAEAIRDVGESDTASNTPFKNRDFKCSKHQAPHTEPSYSSGTSAGNGHIFSVLSPQKYLRPQMFPTQKLEEKMTVNIQCLWYLTLWSWGFSHLSAVRGEVFKQW